MLPPLALNPPAGASVLDMCASPGSKTGFLAQLVGRDGFVLANEPNPSRLHTLTANLNALNLLQASTCSYAGENLPLYESTWSHILLDPPCSGWGTLEKNPRVREIWREEKTGCLVALQRRLLAKAARLLAPGGLLLYSTCTTNHSENEAQTIFAEKELGLERVQIPPFAGFSLDELPGGTGCLRINGAASGAQGFYLSLLRKSGIGLDAASAKLNPRNYEILPNSLLENPFCEPGKLGNGRVGIFGTMARFIPAGADKLLPAAFKWKAQKLGKLPAPGRSFIPEPHLRCLLPRKDENMRGKIILEKISEVKALLSGQSLHCGLSGNHAALWWRELPLGLVLLKSGRVIPRFL